MSIRLHSDLNFPCFGDVVFEKLIFNNDDRRLESGEQAVELLAVVAFAPGLSIESPLLLLFAVLNSQLRSDCLIREVWVDESIEGVLRLNSLDGLAGGRNGDGVSSRVLVLISTVGWGGHSLARGRRKSGNSPSLFLCCRLHIDGLAVVHDFLLEHLDSTQVAPSVFQRHLHRRDFLSVRRPRQAA